MGKDTSQMASLDQMVGQRIKARRQAMKMTQTQLANEIGVTFQQVQKYENGSNRVAAARLWQIGEAFGVPISFFFEGAADQIDSGAPRCVDPLADRGAMEIMELYTRLSTEQRSAVLSFLRSVATDGTAAA